MKAKDYFIKEKSIVAYSIPDLVEGLKEALELGYKIGDANQGRKMGVEIHFPLYKDTSEDESEDTSEDESEDTSEDESEDAPSKPLSEVTDEEIDSFNNFPELKEFANQYGITGRGEIQVKKRLKEARDNS